MKKRTQEGLNTRQMPCRRDITSEKNYCDILYAWIQCNSERATLHSTDRYISKQKVKFTNIEREMVDSEGKSIMNRKTISKYFHWLVEKGFLVEEDKNYRITVLGKDEANIIYYKTLSVLVNVFQRHSIDIYQYLYGRYCACERKPFFVTIPMIKDFIGMSTKTTSNNAKVTDTLNILKRLGLLEYEYKWVDKDKEQIQITKVLDRLPDE